MILSMDDQHLEINKMNGFVGKLNCGGSQYASHEGSSHERILSQLFNTPGVLLGVVHMVLPEIKKQ